ncbi:MAG: PhzF family phenazine biosynthesis protein [Promethearchaeati archaeon SRVP18_Atabeyarchaeia-1]
MKKFTYYIVDVFAEEKYAGNPLAVVRDCKAMPDDEKQRVAREMNFSETTFILSDEKQRNGGYNVRIFTPVEELPFAGHPTLGTAYVIQREIIGKPVEEVTLNLKIGQIPVAFTYREKEADMLWMHQIPPIFGRTFDKHITCDVLSLQENQIDDRFPIQDVSTGIHFIIVPLKNLDALKKAKIWREKYFDLVGNLDAKGILVFCPEAHRPGNDLSIRVFVDYYGVPEDPATGSGNGCLAGYLVKYRYFGENKIDLRAEQGYEIGRPSLLLLKSEEKGGTIDVFVGGRVMYVAKGEFG